MAKQIDIEVKESESDLLKLQNQQPTILKRSRIKALLLIKQRKVTYTRDLSQKLKYERRTIYNWLKIYREDGLSGLVTVNSGGNNTRLIDQTTKSALAKKLAEPDTTITSYVELLEWVQSNYQPSITYSTLYKHCKVHHRSTLKISRKSHHKKDPQAVEVFKKTTKDL